MQDNYLDDILKQKLTTPQRFDFDEAEWDSVATRLDVEMPERKKRKVVGWLFLTIFGLSCSTAYLLFQLQEMESKIYAIENNYVKIEDNQSNNLKPSSDSDVVIDIGTTTNNSPELKTVSTLTTSGNKVFNKVSNRLKHHSIINTPIKSSTAINEVDQETETLTVLPSTKKNKKTDVLQKKEEVPMIINKEEIKETTKNKELPIAQQMSDEIYLQSISGFVKKVEEDNNGIIAEEKSKGFKSLDLSWMRPIAYHVGLSTNYGIHPWEFKNEDSDQLEGLFGANVIGEVVFSNRISLVGSLGYMKEVYSQGVDDNLGIPNYTEPPTNYFLSKAYAEERALIGNIGLKVDVVQFQENFNLYGGLGVSPKYTLDQTYEYTYQNPNFKYSLKKFANTENRQFINHLNLNAGVEYNINNFILQLEGVGYFDPNSSKVMPEWFAVNVGVAYNLAAI